MARARQKTFVLALVSVVGIEKLGHLRAPFLEILEHATKEVLEDGIHTQVNTSVRKARHDFPAYGR
jgi:flavin-dependent dehydrogenase